MTMLMMMVMREGGGRGAEAGGGGGEGDLDLSKHATPEVHGYIYYSPRNVMHTARRLECGGRLLVGERAGDGGAIQPHAEGGQPGQVDVRAAGR